jgi:hypothetical protein
MAAPAAAVIFQEWPGDPSGWQQVSRFAVGTIWLTSPTSVEPCMRRNASLGRITFAQVVDADAISRAPSSALLPRCGAPPPWAAMPWKCTSNEFIARLLPFVQTPLT